MFVFYVVYDGDLFGFNEWLLLFVLFVMLMDMIMSNMMLLILCFNQVVLYLSFDWNGLCVMVMYGFLMLNVLLIQVGCNYGVGLQYWIGGFYVGVGFQGDMLVGNLGFVVVLLMICYYVFVINYVFVWVKLYVVFLYGVGMVVCLFVFLIVSVGVLINVGVFDCVFVLVVCCDVKGLVNDVIVFGVGYDYLLLKWILFYVCYFYMKNGGDVCNIVVVGLQL